MDEEILVTLESVSECNIFERENIVEANQHFQDENLEDFTQLFDLEPPTNLPELLFVDETTLTKSIRH